MKSNKLQTAVFLTALALTTACDSEAVQSDAASASKVKLTGIVWKWERFDAAADLDDFVIDDPSKYTLALLPDGAYQVKADCNRMHGQYTLEGERIKIAPGAATLAECVPGSRYAEYLKHLQEADSFVLHENKLILKLTLERGQLVFGNGGDVPNGNRH